MQVPRQRRERYRGGRLVGVDVPKSIYECAGCGTPVVKARPPKGRPFCSAECYHRATIKHPDRDCAHCGETFSSSAEQKYCSPACYYASRANRAAKTCPACGKDFTVPGSNADRYNVCSRECRTADTLYVDCERCGQSFRASRLLNRRYCSEECRRPPVFIDCRNCGMTFRKRPGEDSKQFCSFACYRSFVGETRLETNVRLALESLGVKFQQEYPAGHWSIDFALIGQRIAIEADGDYWHSRTVERDARRDAELERAGWHVVRLPERDVNASRDLGRFILDRIREVTGLGPAALVSSGKPGQVAVACRDRPAFRLPGRKAAVIGGQLALWGDSDVA